MSINENFTVGLGGLTTHKLRSVLTALGIIFGVAAVIAMLSIGEGARLEALEQIRLMGINNIIIRAKEPTQQSYSKAKASFSIGLTMLDGAAIHEICPNVRDIVPQMEKNSTVQYGSERRDIKLIGTTPEFLPVFSYVIGEGRFLSPQHIASQANVCVIGDGVREAVFHFEQPIGKALKVERQWFTVIGVMGRHGTKAKKIEDLQIRNLNMDIYIPITTFQYKLFRKQGANSNRVMYFGGGMMVSNGGEGFVPRSRLDQIVVKVAGEDVMSETVPVIRRILARRHYNVDDYELIVPDALVEQSQKTQRIFNVVMGAIAGISLLIGGIGIMNIMLASVLERTKEIGIRRAMGARRADVLSQFLFEAVVLSVVGGILGIGVGFSLTKIISLYAGWRTVVSWPAVVLAFGVSAAVGICFGYYPARKAAYQNPIESLRYE